MRNYAFTPDERPTMSAFNQRFESIEELANGIGNEYVWGKQKLGIATTGGKVTNYYISIASSGYVLKYSDTCEVVDGNIELSGEITTIDTSASVPSLTDLNILAGKYFTTTTVRDMSGSVTSLYTNEVLFGDPAGEQFNNSTTLRGFPFYRVSAQMITYGYVNSPDPTAYPPSVSDGYTYTALGQLGAKVRVETGSYVGTGTYGASNPNSLTFDFEPKVVIVMADSIQGYAVYFINPSKMFSNSASGNVTWAGNTIYFYSTSADNQLNVSGKLFDYIGVG